MATNGNLLRAIWQTEPRWQGINLPYTAGNVTRLRGTTRIEYTLARYGAERMWKLLSSEPYVAALGAATPNQAVEQVAAGLKVTYVTGWQVAADGNRAGQMYPHKSLYPANSVPGLCRSINNALQREGFRAIRHQQFVGAGYFEDVAQVITGGNPGQVNASGKPCAAIVRNAVCNAESRGTCRRNEAADRKGGAGLRASIGGSGPCAVPEVAVPTRA